MFILYPDLSTKIDLNGAIILQHIQYLLQNHKNYRGGQVWVYNTYKDWQKQLSFGSIDTIKRIIRKCSITIISQFQGAYFTKIPLALNLLKV